MPAPTLDDLRRHAVARTLFAPTTLAEALERLGFVQADPIRAPARAQDLILRHRVAGYRAGDLERHYATLDVHEDFFVNYGFLAGRWWRLMHPRDRGIAWQPKTRRRAQEVLEFVQARGTAHPREVEAHLGHGTVRNYWGGSSSATTRLLDHLHYRGMLRVARRDNGIRVYAPHAHEARARDAKARRAQVDALVDLVVQVYAPLPARTLSELVRRLRYAVPQHRDEIAAALSRAQERLAHAVVDGLRWYWVPGEDPREVDPAPPRLRFLAPFDPIVWDRRRFEILWGWAYRFEAYTPPARRTLGYYALPVLWGDRVVGWANCSAESGRLRAQVGTLDPRIARERTFREARDAEIARMAAFLDVTPPRGVAAGSP
ncbi:MAG TPA: crosslink repair DNA glycosylase YcaQ family protein [Caldimonas sp.]|nr:crosslink repair DNA glycosylase YcaQ family protein [Caldimonas sp.]